MPKSSKYGNPGALETPNTSLDTDLISGRTAMRSATRSSITENDRSEAFACSASRSASPAPANCVNSLVNPSTTASSATTNPTPIPSPSSVTSAAPRGIRPAERAEQQRGGNRLNEDRRREHAAEQRLHGRRQPGEGRQPDAQPDA